MSNNELEPISTGRYRTRNGILAVVTHTNDKMEAPFFWVGTVAGEIEVWDRIGRYYSNGRESPLDLVARIPDEPPADDRIERALQVLREAVTKSNDAAGFFEGSCEGWEMVDQAIQILESTP